MTALTIENLDNGKLDLDHLGEFATSLELTTTDRIGGVKSTLTGIEALATAQRTSIQASADAILAGMGYLPPVAYTASLSMTTQRQTVSYGGNIYAPNAADLPFTTSGTFETAKFHLIIAGTFIDSGTGSIAQYVQDAILRGGVAIESFGTPGTGSNDNALWTLAAAAAVASGRPIIANAPLYKLNGLVLTTPVAILIGANTEMRNVQTSGTKLKALTFRGALSGTATAITSIDNFTLSTTGSSTIPLGNLSKTFTVASTAGLAVGDTVRIFEDAALSTETKYGTGSASTGDWNYREFATIAAIVGSKITTEEFQRWPYDTAKTLKLQKVAFCDRPSVTGGKWTSSNAGAGGIGFEFCRRAFCDRIQATGNSDADRMGGAPVTFSDCWESVRGSVQTQWSLFSEDTYRNQSCFFGKISGKRTTNGGVYHAGDILCNFAEIVQDSPGVSNGDGIGIANGFRMNTIESFIVSGTNCYGLWLRQSCDDNTFVSYTCSNGITGGAYVFGDRNEFVSFKVRGNPSFGLHFGGDNNRATVDIEVDGTGVSLGASTTGNRVNGRSVSTGTGIASYDVVLGANVKRSVVDLIGGIRGLNYASGAVENYSNDIRLRGPTPANTGVAYTGRGWQWSRSMNIPVGGIVTLQVPGYNTDGTDATNGLVDIAAPAADPCFIYRIALSLQSSLADLRSEYEVVARTGTFTIRTIYEGAGAYATSVPKLRTVGTTLEIWTTVTTASVVVVRIEKA